ncbi:MAG: DNA primase [Tissierellia bacterium]|nr:DNA primase [Tissierellia bacterium]
MVRIPDSKKEEILESTDIVALISDYVDLKKSGSSYVGLCPFHDDRHPSFSVNEQKKLYHCFSCGASGDAIEFVKNIENVDFQTALKILADRSGIKLEYENKQEEQQYKKQNRLFEINHDIMMYFYQNLLTNKRPQDYLRYERKLSNKIVNPFVLGYAKDSWNDLLNYAKSKDYLLDDLVKLGLLSKKNGRYFDKLRDRLIFPIFNKSFKVIGFGARILNDSKPKYLNSPESEIFKKRYNLYAFNNAKRQKEKRIILVEGYMDVIALYARGIKYAVASLGTAFTKEQADLLKSFTNDIYICYDSDQAGINATKKAIEIFKEIKLTAKIISLEEGLDPDEYIQKYGVDRFNEKIDDAKDMWDYLFNDVFSKYNQAPDSQKNISFENFIEFIASLKTDSLKEKYMNELEQRLNISKEAIRSDVKNKIIQNKKQENKKQALKEAFKNKKYSNYENKILKDNMIKIDFENSQVRNQIYILKYCIENRGFFLNDKENIYKLITEENLFKILKLLEKDEISNLEELKDQYDHNVIEKLSDLEDIPILDSINRLIKYKIETLWKRPNKEDKGQRVKITKELEELKNHFARGKDND